MKEKWLENYYDQCGREISLAMETMDNNQNWTITLVSAIIAGIILRGFLPDIWTWSLLIIGLALTIRYFVRSCLAYSNLIRWNLIRKKINKFYLFTQSKNKAEALQDILNSIKSYDDQWLLPLSRKKLIFSNLKYGYYYAFFTLSLMLAYNAFAVYKETSFFGPAAMQILSIGFLGILVVLYEVKGLFDQPYFKYEPQDREKDRKKKFSLNRKTILAIVLLSLILVGVSISAYAETETTVISTSSFTFQIDEYRFSNPIHFDLGTLVEITWQTMQPIGIGLTRYSNVLDYNQSGQNLQAIEFLTGTQGKIDITITSAQDLALFVSYPQANATNGSTTLVLNQSRSPFAIEGIGLSLCALAVLILMVVWHSDKEGKTKKKNDDSSKNSFL